MNPSDLTAQKKAIPLLPKDRNMEGGDSPAGTPRTYPSKRRKVDPNELNGKGHHLAEQEVDSDDDMTDIPTSDISPSDPSKWQTTINNVVKAIVSIRFSQVAAFDTEGAETSQASGFIVDAVNGIILTNRHVACAGPFVGEAVCHDHEEIDVYPIYRDPVHDFGFLKFDPKKIKYMPVTQVELRPELAKVGLDIRVVGNDAGEKLSILAGSISRLDRNTPEYGDLTYNDFNTFYLQAASSTSGGSSGSPVIDINGNAVALQAGGHIKAATDFFLPLDRIKRALQYVQRGETVPRGDIQTHFTYRPFDETRRLGLRPESEDKLRKAFPDEIGLLVVEGVLPEGPAYGKLEEGDILLTMNGQYITKFVPFEEMLDSSVGQNITITIERGGKPMEFTINVGDLHAITPNRYVEIGGAVLNEVSYQLANAYCVPCRGVYVAEPSGMFRLDGPDNGWVIRSVDDKPTPDLDTFIEVMKGIPDRERVPVIYYSITDTHTSLVAVVHVQRHWTPFRMAVRNDSTGLWDFTDFGDPLPPRSIVSSTKRFIELDRSLGPAAHLIRCLVKVNYFMPCRIDGFPRSRRQGAGVILDKERGLVVVSRSIVPTTMGDLTLTVADSLTIPAKVIYLHPTHNFAIAQYDPKMLGDTNVMSAPISDQPLLQGHKVTLVANNQNQRPVCVNTVVTDITCVTIPHNGVPRFRSINLDAITLDTPMALHCSSGLLADANGLVQGLWLNFLGEQNPNNGHDNEYHMGIHIQPVLPILEKLQRGESPTLQSLNIELMPVQMAQATTMGLSDEWISRVEEANPAKHQLFMILRTEVGSDSAKQLKEHDVILAINDKVITRMSEMSVVENAEEVKMTILRQKKEMTVHVKTSTVSGDGTSRVVFWAGAVLQEPHKAVLQQSKNLPSRIYVSGRARGSPAYMYGLEPTMWITHINAVKVVTLDDLIAAVKDIKDNTYVRVRCMSFDNVPIMLSIKTVDHYFKLAEMVKDPSADCGWSAKEHSQSSSSS
ncbi:trypsin-like cysteine/serine peptidase domain-containing protein [Radiomyces spectabilis]|uniref:trypsin-like cysteine/serine peptidase domain-containing protein n=1 Tax=Radiomyces spectabilis TaxID=64574 RepID=UPI00221E9BC3|nr:trypsin-like cysteine/serine peptidase domain-containing protein [Radiomyces spectabilis]KAI8391518.1 trypsin-like cysteine/serine peptidase domain-containing protein [Radiomyces spectabilis]